MSCEIQVARIELGFLSAGVTQHSHLEIVDHHFLGAAPQELQSVAVAG
jgi:hypothetical protein